ncbi:type IX secretion system sortase PorU [Spirosoma knui]
MLGWSNNRDRVQLQRLIPSGQKALWLFALICYSFLTHSPLNAQSVLKEGVWVKIGVTTSGVYRIDQAQLIRLHPAFATADPRRLRLYGNGGAVLPQLNAVQRPGDLLENAIQVSGEADGRFDLGDAVLFFGQSPHTIRYDSLNRRFTHQINPYSDTTYYFLTIGTSPGLRIADREAGTLSNTPTVTSFDDYQFHENDLLKLPSVRSGREWLGEYLTTDTTLTIPLDMRGLRAGAPVRLTASVVAGATVPTQFRVRLNDQLVGSMAMSSVSGYEYDYQGLARTDTFSIVPTVTTSPVQLQLTFQKNGQFSAQGYLNFLAIQARRELRQYNQPTWVRRLMPGQYAVQQSTANLRIWDVANPLAPVNQAYVRSASQEAGWASATSGDYFLFTDAQLLSPASAVTFANQNVRGQSAPDLLIITPAAWQDQAERLAAFRRESDKLTVLVATTQQIYNEFSSGQPDPTAIRDAARYFYQQQAGKLKYLLLFGDATFDYRNIAKLITPSQQANMVPVYESRESLHPVLSYSSDDYFGFMDEAEGEWLETTTGDKRMDIGVGRLPVKSVDEARTVVDKLIRYSSDRSLSGEWQTRVMLVADDGDYNIHQRDADQLATAIETQSPAYKPERIFIDSYVQENTTNGQKAPLVNQTINRAFAEGRLIINYSGHGGILDLADEQVVTLQDILSWKNRRLPLFVTATCQFGRYDDPSVSSGAELALISRTGGAIGLLTTTRPVYANTNLLLNEAFYKAVFTPINGEMPRLGDVMRITKNNSLSGPVNRNFALLGDPSMRLAYPQAEAKLTRINGLAISADRSDTLRALQSVELSGEIQQEQQRLADFTGTIRLVLYDKATVQTTLGAEATSPKMSYQAYTSPIFIGQTSVQQGRFSIRFTVPKDINYSIGRGKLYAYAVRADSLLEAAGSYDSLLIGGSVFADSVDNQPPVVTLSVKDGVQENETVRVAGPDVTLQVRLSDNKGINIARSGLGHELTAQLDNQQPIVLNETYVADGTDGRQGNVIYTFRDMVPGTYQIRVKAWDINNNSTEGALTIRVSERPALTVRALTSSPNPIQAEATLTAELNRSGEPLDWTMGIYDLSGRQYSQRVGQCSDCPSTISVGTWQGVSDAGQPLPNGLYIMTIQVRSTVDGSVANGSGRIVLTK